jgi:hypothetical protein
MLAPKDGISDISHTISQVSALQLLILTLEPATGRTPQVRLVLLSSRGSRSRIIVEILVIVFGLVVRETIGRDLVDRVVSVVIIERIVAGLGTIVINFRAFVSVPRVLILIRLPI